MSGINTATNESIDIPPKNVKEALDWLVCLSRNIGAKRCADVIIKILGQSINLKQNITDLCNKARELLGYEDGQISEKGLAKKREYKSAYAETEPFNKDGANWSLLCKQSGKACCSSAADCSKCQLSKSAPCDVCCENCPQQISARIFCLIIPVLHSVLEFMQKRIDSGGWSGKITEGEIGNFLQACGFDKAKHLNENKQGSDIKEKLKNVVEALKTVNDELAKTLKGDQAKGKFMGTQQSSDGNAVAPASLTDMLLWLQFLPYCSKYKEVLTGVNKLLKGNGALQSNGVDTKLDELITSLPMMFLFVEGANSATTPSGANNGNSLFQKIRKLSKCQHIFKSEYYTDPEKAAKILLSVLPILHWSFGKLNEKCESGNSRTIVDYTETKNFLKSLGWKDGSGSEPKIDGKMQCSDLKKHLDEKLVGSQGKLKEVKEAIEAAWKDSSVASSASITGSNQGQHEPSNIREMLLWLQCLPASGVFEQLRSKIKTAEGGDLNTVMQAFSDVLFQLPSMYHTMEGSFTKLLRSMFEHQGIGDGNTVFKYGTDGDECLKIFPAIVATLCMVVRYLQQRCNGNGDWGQLQLNGNGSKPPSGAEAPELKNFLEHMGFDKMTPANGNMIGSAFKTTVLTPCFGELANSNTAAKLQKMYKCALEYFQKQSLSVGSPQGAKPSTIRQMMLWLIGLPLTQQYNTLTTNSGILSEGEIKKVIDDTASIITDKLKESFVTSACGLAVTIISIEGNATSVLAFLKDGFNDGSNGSYSYGETTGNGASCFDLLKDYAYKVHCQLRFLHYMTKESSDNGGWKECNYGNGTKVQAGKCNGCKSNTSCLMQFLENTDQTLATDPSPGTDDNQYYGLVTTGSDNSMKDVGMGYKNKLRLNPNRTGNDIKYVLDYVCHIEIERPLTRLLNYLVSIDQREPTTLGDIIDLFRQFTCAAQKDLWDHRKISGNGKQQNIDERLTAELEALKGTDKKGADHVSELKTVIQKLYPENHTAIHQKPTYDLLSLGCIEKQHGQTCAPYIRPICHSVWSSYAPKIAESDPNTNVFYTLQWLYDMCYQLLKGLQQLKNVFEKCSCCSKDKCGGSMVECEKALPMLYRQGMTFHTPGNLKDSRKKCKAFMDHLSKVIDRKAPLYIVFEKIIDIFYHILLSRVKGCVTNKSETFNSNLFKGRQEDKEQWEKALEDYVNKTMEQSKIRLQCTFLCILFGIKNCKLHNSSVTASPSNPTALSAQSVLSITAVILPYRPPQIDRYHYKTYPKNGTSPPVVKDDFYTFTNAINFHVQGAQCLTPTPVALRSVIDWLLRVTVGKVLRHGEDWNVDNHNIKKLADKVSTVLQNKGIKNAENQTHVSSLVNGLRKLMGYTDSSPEVKTSVTKNLGGRKDDYAIKTLLEDKIKAIGGFLTGTNDFANEMGKALMKGTYECKDNGRPISGEPKAFKTIIGDLQVKLSAKHEVCDAVNCTHFNKDSATTPYSNTVTAEGLRQLHEFLELLKQFADLWTTIGKGHGNEILQTKKSEAMRELTLEGTNQPNTEYFTNLYKALQQLGSCVTQVNELQNNSHGAMDSNTYRGKISALITELKQFGDHIKDCDFMKDSKDIDSNGKSDTAYALKAGDVLIRLTKSKVEEEIIKGMKTGVEEKYDVLSKQHNGPCKAHSRSSHQQSQPYLCIEIAITSITGLISSEIDKYKEHIYDLKQLCQWLYRMGQLYANGLKGFVESLVKHLEHIVQVIKWIEGIEKMVKQLKDIKNKDDVTQTINGFNDIQLCCNSHNNLYDTSQFQNRDNFFTALNCRINNLLVSYVLHELPKGTDHNNDTEKVQERIKVLTELRLLALDRYTLQVWEDDEKHIKDWITFNGGIVRQSGLEEIKKRLSELTGIHYSASSPTRRNRIHDFHAICVIQKFSYEAPIAQLERSLKELNRIKDKLNAVKGKCDTPNGGTDFSNDQQVKPFCTTVDKFLAEPYGIYNFAKFVHTIMGPNIFSAVIGALEEFTTEKCNRLNNQNDNKNKFCGIINIMHEGLKGKDRADHYKLDEIIKKLNSFLATLKREYIFSYPVVTAGTQSRVVASPSGLSTSDHTATGILDRLKTVTPTCVSEKDAHKNGSICPKCWNVFAYTFLGQVPKLYHSFKFMSWMSKEEWRSDSSNASITSYLVSMGIEDTKIEKKANQNKLHDTMKSALEGFEKNDPSAGTNTPSHDPKGLKEIHEKLEELLKRLIREQHTNALECLLKSGKDTRRRPGTIREMLHWLSGVPFSVVYEGMQTFSNSLCDLSLAVKDYKSGVRVHNIKPEAIEYRLGVSCAECLDVLQAVEDPLGKEPTKRFKEYIGTHSFYYPANASQLFYMFVDVMYYVYVHMKFVCNMTGRERKDGGWKDCRYNEEGGMDYRGAVCQCNSAIEHKCSGPLRRLLQGHHGNVFTGRSLGFQLPKERLYNASVVGSAIHSVIKHIFGKGDNYSTLCRLLLAVSTCPPMSIGDMISFLYWYRQALFEDKGNQNNADECKSALHHEIELFPGTFEPEKLIIALNDCFNGHTEGQLRQIAHDESNKDNMLSIMDCLGQADESIQAPCTNVNCAPYLRPLAYEVYDTYVPQFSRAYLSWILHFGPRVYTALEEIKGKLKEDCKHCTTNNGSIVTCNGVLPELYSKGLDFWDPKVLNGQKKKQGGEYQTNGQPNARKKCSYMITQLGNVLKPCDKRDPSSPGASLHRLIEAIEAFLWSIRMPFSLVQLSLWSVAILFISYVFVVPLDHFKIKSHLFNRLKYTMHPSLLISDGQRRLSEVAYFAL